MWGGLVCTLVTEICSVAYRYFFDNRDPLGSSCELSAEKYTPALGFLISGPTTKHWKGHSGFAVLWPGRRDLCISRI